MNTMILTQSPWSRLTALFAAALMALLVAACGGSGAGAGGKAGGGTTGVTKAAQLDLLTSITSLASDGKKTAVITALVRNELNVSLANQPVEFSTTDSGAILEVTEVATDATGRIEARLSITDRSVRTITVTAKAGTLVRTIDVPVVGTELQLNGSSTIVFGARTKYSLSLRDSGGNPITGAPVQVTSTNGNTIEPAAVTTNSLGQAEFEVVGVNAGNDVITASAQGVSKSINTSVSSTQLIYDAPGDYQELIVDAAANVTTRLVESGVPLSGRTIRFTVTRGNFVGSDTAVTDGSGVATVQVVSANAGRATLTATEIQGGVSSGVTATREVEFVSKSPNKIELQASPTVVGANLAATGTNSSQLIAVVRDANDNPVKNARVDFTALADPSNGRIEPAYGITDSFGTATSSFIAGPTTTGFKAVKLQARVSDLPTITANAELTVSQQELSVRVGTGNELREDGSLTHYRMPWTSIIADSSGNPVESARVTVALQPIGYFKGEWLLDPTAGWGLPAEASRTYCPSEDLNENGRLDQDNTVDEDNNGNGELDPGAVATSNVIAQESLTNADGLAEIDIVYPKTYGRWVKVRMSVTITTVAGTEATADSEFVLPVAADDVSNPEIMPPGASAPVGPFGASADCATTD